VLEPPDRVLLCLLDSAADGAEVLGPCARSQAPADLALEFEYHDARSATLLAGLRAGSAE